MYEVSGYSKGDGESRLQVGRRTSILRLFGLFGSSNHDLRGKIYLINANCTAIGTEII